MCKEGNNDIYYTNDCKDKTFGLNTENKSYLLVDPTWHDNFSFESKY